MTLAERIQEDIARAEAVRLELEWFYTKHYVLHQRQKAIYNSTEQGVKL